MRLAELNAAHTHTPNVRACGWMNGWMCVCVCEFAKFSMTKSGIALCRLAFYLCLYTHG